MPPESKALPTTADTSTSFAQTHLTTQHGRHDDTAAGSLLSGTEPERRGTLPSLPSLQQPNLAGAALLPDATRTGLDRGLSSRSSPSPPARTRVAEYEQASTPPIKKRDGPAFEVIKKHRSPNDKHSPIQHLPNEILTHSLAHLTPIDLTSISLVSKRFHDLVTGPHAWRSAFAHFFPGHESINASQADTEDGEQRVVLADKRAFARLTALASWRSEYIMRTRLLRSLYRGKPVQPVGSSASSRTGQSHTVAPSIAYNSSLFTTINHLHATYGSGSNKRLPRFVHGADDVGTATSSDPSTGKVDNWGLSDPHTFLQFAERFPGDAQYGLGPGEVVGAPNVMDVSQPYGVVLGEGSPGGTTYYRAADEMRGRFLELSLGISVPEIGVPRVPPANEAVTAIWIAKSTSTPGMTEGLIGILSGSSAGVLSGYSLGASGGPSQRDHRFPRGELTARWVLSPGVPIIALAVDNEYNLTRYTQNRIWAVALNALGEVFYLTKFPKRPHIDRGTQLNPEAIEQFAWQTGRSVFWSLAEPSRRIAKHDPYAESSVDGSYSPRTSWNGMCLSKAQVQAETREIEAFVARKPKDFQHTCLGWDMRRKLVVDFAGDDGNNAGEHILVLQCGLGENAAVRIHRYSRCRIHERSSEPITPPSMTTGSTGPSSPPSMFGGGASPILNVGPGVTFERLEDSLAHDDFTGSLTPRATTEEWRTTMYSLGGMKYLQITATAIDSSTFAVQTIAEDPLLSFSGRSTNSSPLLTPLSPTAQPPSSAADVPGQRARLIAVGTTSGSILLFNMRAAVSRSADITAYADPVRIIHTDSPEIACLALTSLYLVHGGNDGLVQAWDPLASSMQPIRTLNSKFISRARRRLIQAQASPQGVGINLFAAGAISLDPDPTVLRGMVSLGLQLFYWSYSSSAADQYKSQKRQLRRSERGSNNGGERFSGASRSNIKDYIANEKYELQREKESRRKETERFAGRFGTELLGGSEAEMIAYAEMLSQESLEQEYRQRTSDPSTMASSVAGSTADVTPALTPSPRKPSLKADDEFDADIEEAIRQSLASSPGYEREIAIKPAKQKDRTGSSAKNSPRPSPALAGSGRALEISDLEFALRLSLAEEQSKQYEVTGGEQYPRLAASRDDSQDKGKGLLD